MGGGEARFLASGEGSPVQLRVLAHRLGNKGKAFPIGVPGLMEAIQDCS